MMFVRLVVDIASDKLWFLRLHIRRVGAVNVRGINKTLTTHYKRVTFLCKKFQNGRSEERFWELKVQRWNRIFTTFT